MKTIEQIVKSLEAKELESVLINSTDNSLQLRVSENGKFPEKIELGGILEFNYIPDFTDSGPWLIMDCEFQSGSLKKFINKLRLLWTKESFAIENWLNEEVFRLKLLSGDFELTVTFKEILTGYNNT